MGPRALEPSDRRGGSDGGVGVTDEFLARVSSGGGGSRLNRRRRSRSEPEAILFSTMLGGGELLKTQPADAGLFWNACLIFCATSRTHCRSVEHGFCGVPVPRCSVQGRERGRTDIRAATELETVRSRVQMMLAAANDSSSLTASGERGCSGSRRATTGSQAARQAGRVVVVLGGG